MHALFAEIEAYHHFYLPVTGGHTLYVEEAGNPKGQPALFLHGGPGGGISANHRRLFDPAHYRIILFDQRGAGKSRPHASLENNTTWDLVTDIESIRTHLNIEQWLVFGGSWGSTLSLAYAQKHPLRVTHLILRGIFLCRPEEIEWFYQSGTRWIFPEFWAEFMQPVPPEKQGAMVQTYYELLTSPNEPLRLQAAKAWSKWEGATCKLIPDPQVMDHFEEAAHALAMARIECHYFVNHCWLEPNQLLRDAFKIAHIPTWIIHGRYDVVCPAQNAYELAQALPQAKLEMIADAGHAYDEPGILNALIEATEQSKLPL
ncbi:prolyl aminopeptidase [Vampirovibrio sp.]|uniref:prolyl aminopeptidase n=1 Tax=Vampirovibrio sp. TaxID=2717857 RepID=UPI0035932428